MVIITFTSLREYALKNNRAKVAIFHWYSVAEKAGWSCLDDINKEFPSVDYVGNDRYVFNIKGNQYRLVALIHFSTRTVYIRFIGSHSEYGKIEADFV